MAEAAYYRRQAELTKNEPELARFYLAKAAEVVQAERQPQIELLTRQYVSELSRLVELPDRVTLEVKACD